MRFAYSELTMTVVFVLAVWMLFAFNFSAYRYASAESEDLNQSPDWKFAIRKIKELENRIKIQDERIATLEKRSLDEEWKSVINLQKTVQKQNDRINQLEARIYELEGIVQDENIESVQTKLPTNVSEPNNSTIRSDKSMIRKGIFELHVAFLREMFSYSCLSSGIIQDQQNEK